MTAHLPSIQDLLKKTPGPSYVPESEKTAPERFEEKLSDIRLKEKEGEAMKAASASGASYVALRGFAISPEALSLIPEETARNISAAAFLFTGPEVRIGALRPNDPSVTELAFQIGERNKTHVGLYLISEDSLSYAIGLYATLPKIKPIIKGVQITEEELAKYRRSIAGLADIAKILASASTTDVITVLTAAALELDSSDIHIEAEEKSIQVRFRVDGILREVANLPNESWKKIIARLKLLSGLKINITDRPQDGRMTIFLKEGKTEVRVSALPTTWGESVVMRLLKPTATAVDFETLGLRPNIQKKLQTQMDKPHGMILTTGPTGSGKTTTLYSMLRRLNKPGVKIITLEDPIEYKLEGINQSQVDASKNYTFAAGLRSVLRQDPDIVMVGEIRDLETAETAINAALTGHLLLSTIHTNDAAGAIPRFLSMGAKSFLLCQALNAVIGQRLVRKLCPTCKVPSTLAPEVLENVRKALQEIPEASGEKLASLENLTFFAAGAGCDKCHGGYKGRLGIYEVLVMDADVEKVTREGVVSEFDMRKIAENQGMVTMYQDGLLKALEGTTSIEEVNRVAIT